MTRRTTWVTAAATLCSTAALLLLLGGCRDSTGPSAPASLLPLGAGTQWSYELVDSVEVGTGPGLSPQPFTVWVRSDAVLEGEHWAVVEGGAQLFDGLLTGEPVYLANRRGGLWRTELPDPVLPLPISALRMLMLPYPARVGDGTLSWRVASADTVITVPAGTFRCVRYDALGVGPDVDETYFVAPGTGVVKKVFGLTQVYDSQGVLLERWRLVYRLTAYHVGSSPR